MATHKKSVFEKRITRWPYQPGTKCYKWWISQRSNLLTYYDILMYEKTLVPSTKRKKPIRNIK